VAVRGVAESAIPRSRAVGHETDWTLIDHAADLRAPTPTGAAEKAVPVRAELAANIRELASRHELAVHRFLESERRHYVTLCRALPSLGDLLSLPRQRLDESGGRLGRALANNFLAPKQRLTEVRGRLARSLAAETAKKRRDFAAAAARLTPPVLARAQLLRRERLGATVGRLDAASGASLRHLRRDMVRTAGRLNIACVARIIARHRDRYGQACRLFQTLRETASPAAILAKGYAIVLDSAGRAVRSPDEVASGDSLTIRVAEGNIDAPGFRSASRRAQASQGESEAKPDGSARLPVLAKCLPARLAAIGAIRRVGLGPGAARTNRAWPRK
jgi:exodeoxyribonuclease VII large subunit